MSPARLPVRLRFPSLAGPAPPPLPLLRSQPAAGRAGSGRLRPGRLSTGGRPLPVFRSAERGGLLPASLDTPICLCPALGPRPGLPHTGPARLASTAATYCVREGTAPPLHEQEGPDDHRTFGIL